MNSVAFLGCAHIHTPGFIKMISGRTDAKVKSVWDHDAARGQKRADELGARFFADYRAILQDAEISAVIISSETDRHEELVSAACEAKKHLFVEKPLGMTGRDANKMADAIERAGVIFQTGYFRRGDPLHRFLKQQVEQGSFGQITRIRGSNCHSGALGGWFDTEWRWMADPKVAGCGAFGDLGTHSLDIMLWLMGDVEEATALLSTGTKRYGDCDETGEGLMRFKNGAIGTLAAAWDDVANVEPLMISGTEGHASIVRGELFFTSKKIEGADGKTPWKTGLEAPMPHAFELFLDAINGKNVPLVKPREAAYRNVVMDALYEGAKSKKWVPVKK